MHIEEVHVWRGSPEQQALRAQALKTSQFAYFDAELDHPDWTGKSVLDFGGNRGGLLADPSCRIRPADYYCLDVIKEAIDQGRITFPDSHWFHYDRYNCSFNPSGVVDLPIPDLGQDFDIILAYSVFTHTTLAEMKDLVEQLAARLAPGGTLAFTFIDPHWKENLKWRLERANPEGDLEAVLAQSRSARWCSLVNGVEFYVESSGSWTNEANETVESCMTYHVFYTEAFMRELFPQAIIRTPVNDEMQHCCLIRR